MWDLKLIHTTKQKYQKFLAKSIETGPTGQPTLRYADKAGKKKTGKQTTQSLFGTAFLKRPGLILGYWIEYIDFIWHPLKNKKQNEHYNHALLCSVQKKHGTYSQKVKWCIWLWCRVSVMWFSKQAGNFSLKHEQYPDHQIEVVDN